MYQVALLSLWARGDSFCDADVIDVNQCDAVRLERRREYVKGEVASANVEAMAVARSAQLYDNTRDECVRR